MNNLDPMWQSLLLAGFFAVGMYVTLWIASKFSRPDEK
jgi:hypothetical protein